MNNKVDVNSKTTKSKQKSNKVAVDGNFFRKLRKLLKILLPSWNVSEVKLRFVLDIVNTLNFDHQVDPKNFKLKN